MPAAKTPKHFPGSDKLGALGQSLLERFFPPDELPTPAIMTLSAGQRLNNLLNHVEDLKGTAFEDGINELAERAPNVLGHVDRIYPRMMSGPDKLSTLGQFLQNPAQSVAGPRKGFPIGSISLNELLNGPWRGNPAKTLGHEVGHAAQAAMKGRRFTSQYALNKKEFEQGANKVGDNLWNRLTRP